MARDHARLLCSIWADDDFRELSPEAQRLYLLLISQRTINNAGVLPLMVNKWARGSKYTTVSDVETALEELRANDYVRVDEDTDEVLVRSFMRNDKVYKQPQILRNALREAVHVDSPSIRRALAVELRRIGTNETIETADELAPNDPPEPPPNGSAPPDSEPCPQGAAQANGSLPAGFQSSLTEGCAQGQTEQCGNPAPRSAGTGLGKGKGRSGNVDPHLGKAASRAPTPTHASPAELNRTATRVGGTTLVIGWRSDRGLSLTNTTTRELAKEVDRLLGDRADSELMYATLDDWLTRGKSPKFLRYCYDDQVKAAFASRNRNGLRAVVGGPYQDPEDLSEYDEPL